MLKEYTLKVTVRVGGADESECEESINRLIEGMAWTYECTPEITHEEVVCETEKD